MQQAYLAIQQTLVENPLYAGYTAGVMKMNKIQFLPLSS